MSNVTEVVKTVSLDLSDVPPEKKKEAKSEVRDYLLNEVLRAVGNGKSPVEKEKFKILTKEYAKKEHAGRRLPILELDGDMLAALKTKNLRGDDIEIGIRGGQAPKADGHNQISGEAKAWARRTSRTEYKRRFIPDDNQKFKLGIRKGIEEIIEGYRVREEEIEEEEVEVREIGRPIEDEVITTPETTAISLGVNEFFSDDLIEQLLLDALRRRDF